MTGRLARYGGVRERARIAQLRPARFSRGFGVALCAAVVCASAQVANAGVAAGSQISNTAHVRYELGGIVHEIDTNAVIVRVDELVVFEVSDAVATTTDTNSADTVLAFNVRNAGNGCESVALDASTSTGANVADIAIDTNNDGVFDPAIDAAYIAASAPRLCPGQSVRVFAIMRQAGTNNATDGEVTLTARGASATDTHGDVVVGAGDAGGDVVVGHSLPHRRWFAFGDADAVRVSLLKSQAVLNKSAATSVNEGDVIAYTLRIRADGAGQVENAVLTDPLPAGVAYLAGSLSVDGRLLSDGADGDFGDVAGDLITVRLPTAQAPFEHIVTFNARVRAPL